MRWPAVGSDNSSDGKSARHAWTAASSAYVERGNKVKWKPVRQNGRQETVVNWLNFYGLFTPHYFITRQFTCAHIAPAIFRAYAHKHTRTMHKLCHLIFIWSDWLVEFSLFLSFLLLTAFHSNAAECTIVYANIGAKEKTELPSSKSLSHCAGMLRPFCFSMLRHAAEKGGKQISTTFSGRNFRIVFLVRWLLNARTHAYATL